LQLKLSEHKIQLFCNNTHASKTAHRTTKHRITTIFTCCKPLQQSAENKDIILSNVNISKRILISNICLHAYNCSLTDNTQIKGKSNDNLYSVSSRTPLTCSDMDHTVLPANNTISAFTISIPQAAPPRTYTQRTPEFNLLLIYQAQEDEWLSWPCWLTYSGQFTLKKSTVNCMSWRRPGKVRRS